MRRLSQDEGGAIAVLVALLLVVMMGLSSIVIDAGGLYYERRQLQNAADAAALAIAYDCAGGDCGTPATTASDLALANTDGSNVENIALSVAAGEVTVDVRSGESDGSPGVVNNVFHAATTALLGAGSGNETSIVRASATATWGGVGLPPTVPLPVAASLCDFMGSPGPFSVADLDAKAATLPSVDQLPRDGAGNVTGGILIRIHDAGDVDACTVSPGFSAEGETKMPGGFGWLVAGSGCEVNVLGTEQDGQFWVNGETGVAGGGTTGRACVSAQYQQAPIVPIFTGFKPSPPRQYRLYAPAAFYITGMRLTGSTVRPAGFSCGSGCNAIQGHFVQRVDSQAPISGGPSLGINAVELTN